MKLLLALGNPEARYDGTRHNVGFFMADMIARECGVAFGEKPKFKAFIAQTSLAGETLIIAKPTTYYNNVGESARAITDFYKIAPEDTLIIHDELSLPFGTLRIRQGGRDAGNNGIKSMNAHLESSTWRLRVGVANDFLPRIGAHNFVLGAFSGVEVAHLKTLAPTIMPIVQSFANKTPSPHTITTLQDTTAP